MVRNTNVALSHSDYQVILIAIKPETFQKIRIFHEKRLSKVQSIET